MPISSLICKNQYYGIIHLTITSKFELKINIYAFRYFQIYYYSDNISVYFQNAFTMAYALLLARASVFQDASRAPAR